MVDSQISRENFQYATRLRQEGYPTAVHALPKEAINWVNYRLGEGWKGWRISKEINQKYGQYMKERGYKPLSRFAIDTYRTKYWLLSPAFSNLVLMGDKKTRDEIAEIHTRYHSYLELVRIIQTYDHLVDKANEFTKNLPVPPKRVMDMLLKSHHMHKTMLEEEIKLGIYQPPQNNPRQNNLDNSQSNELIDLTPEELEARVASLLDTIRRHNRPVIITGDNLSVQANKV